MNRKHFFAAVILLSLLIMGLQLVFAEDPPPPPTPPTEPHVEIAIDIKPGSYPNSINLGSKGLVPVAILSSTDFDATSVIPNTVRFAGAGVAVRGNGKNELAHEEDVNGDELLDLVLQVETENLIPAMFQNGWATLLADNPALDPPDLLWGYDAITIVPE